MGAKDDENAGLFLRVLGAIGIGFALFLTLFVVVVLTFGVEVIDPFMTYGSYIWIVLSVVSYPYSKKYIRKVE